MRYRQFIGYHLPCEIELAQLSAKRSLAQKTDDDITRSSGKYQVFKPMAHYRPDCLGNYDFDSIVFYAKKRFVDGCSTVALIEQAETQREKEEIALVCMLDIEDADIVNIQLSCRYATKCKITDCRDLLRKMIRVKLSL